MCDGGPLPFWPNFFAKTMASCYLVLCVFAGVQLLRTIIHRHKTRSFRFGFLLVCWLWTALRVFFWFILTLDGTATWFWHLIYQLPNACQVGTFSLLILFYAKLVHRHRWRALRLRFLSFCILSNTAMVLLTVAFSVLMEKVENAQGDDPSSEDAADVSELVDKMYYLSCALFFGVLVILAAFYIHKLRTARRNTAGTSPQEVAVTCIVFAIFLSRCVWDALAAFDSTSSLFRQGLCETPDSHVKLMATETFVLLFVWEIVPTLMVVGYFRNIPATSDSYCVGKWACVGPGRLRTCLEGWPFYLPAEYFEPSDMAGAGVLSPAGMGSDDDGMPDLGVGRHGSDVGPLGRINAPAPPYMAMRDTDTTGSQSSFLPPGSFVRSTPVNHANMHRPGVMGAAGMQHLSVSHADLYGSPTWLNAQHPALVHLSPSPHVGAAPPSSAQQQHPQSSYGQQQQQHPGYAHSSHVAYTQLATASVNGSGAGYAAGPQGQGQGAAHLYATGGAARGFARYDEEPDYDYGAHPYTQQQQQQQQQQQALVAAAAGQQQQPQQQQQQRPPLHASRSNARM